MPRATEAYKGGYRMTGGSDANDIDKLLGTLSVLLDQAGTTSSLLSSIVNADGNLAVHVTDATYTGTLLQGTTPWMHNFQGASAGSNLFIGINAGNFTLGAGSAYNVGVGDGALQRITLGAVDNVAVGYLAGNNITTGNCNVLVGMDAGRMIGPAVENTVVGQDCLLNHYTGNYNVCIGGDNSYYRVKGDNNTIVGTDICTNHSTGNYNTAVGFQALTGPALQDLGLTPSATGGNMSNAQFWYAVTAVDASGREKVISKTAAEYNNTTVPGAGNTGSVVITWTTPPYMTPTSYKVYRSSAACQFPASSLISSSATSPFTDTLASPSAGTLPACTSSNVAVGYQCLFQNIGESNVAVGPSAMSANLTGYENVAIGPTALNNNLVGIRNVAIGKNALSANLASYNVAIGYEALAKNTDGSANTAIGQSALAAVTTSTNNTAIGQSAGLSLAGLAANNKDHDCTFIGTSAGQSVNGGYGYNTMIGSTAGFYGVAVTTGYSNTFIGGRAGVKSPGTGAVTGSTAIGYLAQVTIDNQVVIGGTSIAAYTLGTQLPIHANNAAAAAVLPVGSLYRTGADPDPVCIVH